MKSIVWTAFGIELNCIPRSRIWLASEDGHPIGITEYKSSPSFSFKELAEGHSSPVTAISTEEQQKIFKDWKKRYSLQLLMYIESRSLNVIVTVEPFVRCMDTTPNTYAGWTFCCLSRSSHWNQLKKASPAELMLIVLMEMSCSVRLRNTWKPWRAKRIYRIAMRFSVRCVRIALLVPILKLDDVVVLFLL